jgi:hypothetical protein
VGVVRGIPIESLLPTADLEFANQPGLDENLEIPVDGCQTDARQFFSDALVQLVSGGMGLTPSQLVQNDLPLMGHAQGSIHGHLS